MVTVQFGCVETYTEVYLVNPPWIRCGFIDGLELSPACGLLPEVELEPESPHVPASEHVVYRMHHHGQEHGFEKFHRDVVIEHDPERHIILGDGERWERLQHLLAQIFTASCSCLS